MLMGNVIAPWIILTGSTSSCGGSIRREVVGMDSGCTGLSFDRDWDPTFGQVCARVTFLKKSLIACHPSP